MSDYFFRIFIFGKTGVGRLTLSQEFLISYFEENYRKTVGVDFATKRIEINDVQIQFDIWIPSDEERFRRMLPMWLTGCLGAFLMYDITNTESLSHLSEWIQTIRERRGNIPIILIGNKLDLEKYRKISKETGREIKEKHNLAAYMEISAKTGENLDFVFKELARLILKQSNDST